jgi:hypothetical protein
MRSTPPTGRIDLEYPVPPLYDDKRELEPFGRKVYTIDGLVSDKVLMRFRDIMVQVPPEILESVDKSLYPHFYCCFLGFVKVS